MNPALNSSRVESALRTILKVRLPRQLADIADKGGGKMEFRDRIARITNDEEGERSGLFVQDLAVGDNLQIKTLNSVYLFQVVRPKKRILRFLGSTNNIWKISGSKKIFLIARGASLNKESALIQKGWICPGLCFRVGAYTLSETVSVQINNKEIIFPPPYQLN